MSKKRPVNWYVILRAALSPEQHTRAGLLLFLFAFVTLECSIHALAPVIEHTALALSPWHPAPNTIAHHFVAFLGTLLSFVLALVVILLWARAQDTAPAAVVEGLPRKSRGLIIGLSTPAKTAAAEITAAIDNAGGRPSIESLGELRAKLLESNWGPLAAAVEYHGEELKQVWLLCTKEAAPHFENARRILQVVIGCSAPIKQCDLDNPSSITAVEKNVEKIYSAAGPDLNLSDADIVADLTGGTSAVTAGLARAVGSNPHRRIEWLDQSKKLAWRGDDGVLHARTAVQVAEDKVLIEVRTAS